MKHGTKMRYLAAEARSDSFRHPPTDMEEKLQLNAVYLLFLWPRFI